MFRLSDFLYCIKYVGHILYFNKILYKNTTLDTIRIFGNTNINCTARKLNLDKFELKILPFHNIYFLPSILFSCQFFKPIFRFDISLSCKGRNPGIYVFHLFPFCLLTVQYLDRAFRRCTAPFFST